MEGQRDDGYDGYVQVKVEPSRRYEHSIYVEVNDHFELRQTADKQRGAEKLVEILTNQWLPAAQRSIALGQQLLTVAARE